MTTSPACSTRRSSTTGLSTPSLPLAGPSRFSSISPVTRIASPSPTAVWCRSMIRTSPLTGRTTLTAGGSRWISCKPGFFLPVRVLSKVFRGKFIDLLKRARAGGKLIGVENEDAFTRLLNASVKHDWVVYAKPPFAGPDAVLAYLGRYTHRVAIANSRSTQLSHRCSCDSSKAAENCGVPKPPLICGAKESLPFSWVFGLTGSTTVWWHSWPRKAFRSAGRQKSRLCRDFRSVTSPNSPTSPGRCGA